MFRLMIVSFMVVNCECKILNPVILVPGDGGSQIEAKLNKSTANPWCDLHTKGYYNLWVNQEELFFLTVDCFTDNMRLVYDQHKHVTRNSPGVETRIPGWGHTKTVEWLDPERVTDVYTNKPNQGVTFQICSRTFLVGQLKDASGIKGGRFLDMHSDHLTFHPLKAPNEFADFFKNFKALIEETYTLNNNTKVVLLGHSMGNPTTLYFLNHQPQAWKDKFIQSFISLAGVWGGSVKSLILLATVRQQQRSMPSTAWLMPSDKFWGKDEILVERPGRNYTVHDFKQLFTDMNLIDGWHIRKDTANLIRSLTPPGVEVHCIHGHDVQTPQTPEKLVFKGHMWNDKQLNVKMGDGDGTVNIRSLKGCLHWQGKQPQKIYHLPIEGADHMEILGNKDVIAYL
ncbi:lysophospholipase III [Mytilus galloprovincialis]|uniref:Lysophospholipase III n=1 Tax=Mytilus galloprovincialis TaxID=29158 RepID=A0A8B6G867_MYTGA|nr:lysophospholipase III [Mytilus galloprovincialis]